MPWSNPSRLMLLNLADNGTVGMKIEKHTLIKSTLVATELRTKPNWYFFSAWLSFKQEPHDVHLIL